MFVFRLNWFQVSSIPIDGEFAAFSEDEFRVEKRDDTEDNTEDNTDCQDSNLCKQYVLTAYGTIDPSTEDEGKRKERVCKPSLYRKQCCATCQGFVEP